MVGEHPSPPPLMLMIPLRHIPQPADACSHFVFQDLFICVLFLSLASLPVKSTWIVYVWSFRFSSHNVGCFNYKYIHILIESYINYKYILTLNLWVNNLIWIIFTWNSKIIDIVLHNMKLLIILYGAKFIRMKVESSQNLVLIRCWRTLHNIV